MREICLSRNWTEWCISDFRRQMRVNIAAGRNFAGLPERASQLVIVASSPRLALFADPATQRESGGRGRSPLAITPMSRPSEAARTAGCAVAKRKPQTGGIFFFHEDTRTTRVPLAYRITYLVEEEVEEETTRRKRVAAAYGGELGRIEIQSDGRLATRAYYETKAARKSDATGVYRSK